MFYSILLCKYVVLSNVCNCWNCEVFSITSLSYSIITYLLFLTITNILVYTLTEQCRVLRVVLDTWLSFEYEKKAKRIERSLERMHESTQLIWHIHRINRRQSSALIICVERVFYSARLLLLSYCRRSQIVAESAKL